MSDRRRLFFALWPDDPVRHALLHWQTHNLPGDVRWQHRADLHLTLHFLGMVDAARVDALIQLGDEVQMPCFGLVLDQIGHWSRPQVLWCGSSSLPAELRAFQQRLGGKLTDLGFACDPRPFKPHVTLARKVSRGVVPGPLAPVSWLVQEWALVESAAGEVPVYHPLRRWRALAAAS
jgi:2'-5' RNA ligase